MWLKLYTYIYDLYFKKMNFILTFKKNYYALPGNQTTKLKQSDITKATTQPTALRSNHEDECLK